MTIIADYKYHPSRVRLEEKHDRHTDNTVKVQYVVTLEQYHGKEVKFTYGDRDRAEECYSDFVDALRNHLGLIERHKKDAIFE